jgi:meso-butanediol dehydrogenase/(S,S)-butanediol dehydrogenase/diacetyl reductase
MSNRRFDNRIVFITGASSGIGRAAALHFAQEGAKVFAVDVNGEGVDETIRAIREAGGTAEGFVCDVAVMQSVRSAVDRAVSAFGGLHVLVNAAGVGRALRFEELDETEWNRVMSVNLNGTFHTTKAAMEHLLQHPGGNIVNIASIAGLRGQAYSSHYCASKAGLLNFTRSLALEFASRGLRANCVCPGAVLTPLIEHFIPREDFEMQLVSYYCPPVPGHLWAPEDLSGVILFLASDDARMVNGIALVADGGTIA